MTKERKANMPYYELGERFESSIAGSGITFVNIYEENQCGSCVKMKEAIQKLATLPDVVGINVNTKTCPTVRYKYGVFGSCVIIYYNGKFVKRTFPGHGDYLYFEECINRIKAGQPADKPEDCKPITPMKQDIKMMRIKETDFPEWVIKEENAKYVFPINNRFIFDPQNREYIIIYVEPRPQ